MATNCKIISVNPDSGSFESVQGFGIETENGVKTRYVKRRRKIMSFISSYIDPFYNFEVFEAVTPSKFEIKEDFVSYKKYTLGYYKDYNEHTSFYVSNNLSHFELWNIDEDTLILEDDVLLEKETFENLKPILMEFESSKKDNQILYLQLSIPWIQGNPDKSFITDKITDKLGKYKNGDISGTAALYISRECKKIILSNIRHLCATDRYLDNLLKDGIIEYVLPNDYTSMFRLDNTVTMI